MDIRKVKKLIELMEESDITEIEIKEGEESVRISRASTAIVSVGTIEKNDQTQGSPNTIRNSTKNRQKTARDSSEQDEKYLGEVVSAPMVGTFYQSPAPESPPFVKVGSQVEIGDTLCIIESMKMMNQILADRAGVIESILVKNEGLVEYDQALFTIA
ncbi:MAG: acetyl-CoA carboxylase biotin carboxyl carrier protein [Candidatus Azotimanducaceae bacterium]|jgi:acetyl-CoA carboxylase biotin carboxyl carrier protein